MIQEIVTKADGIVFSTPEYHGSMSSVAKLIIENLSYPSVLADKPVVMMSCRRRHRSDQNAGAIAWYTVPHWRHRVAFPGQCAARSQSI